MQVLMFLLLIVGNMRNMQYNMQQYAKYANTISICRICTPHFADVDGMSLTSVANLMLLSCSDSDGKLRRRLQ